MPQNMWSRLAMLATWGRAADIEREVCRTMDSTWDSDNPHLSPNPHMVPDSFFVVLSLEQLGIIQDLHVVSREVQESSTVLYCITLDDTGSGPE